ncbi:hypothetical protein GOBAR_DD11551 [Gossypium barbadense]|nr:hypothetical protein GOBAR_DD11551 [Gossypium barbadense]
MFKCQVRDLKTKQVLLSGLVHDGLYKLHLKGSGEPMTADGAIPNATQKSSKLLVVQPNSTGRGTSGDHTLRQSPNVQVACDQGVSTSSQSQNVQLACNQGVSTASQSQTVQVSREQAE